MTEAPDTIGVAGAGTMGAGIAQLACLSGARTLLHDPIREALERGIEQIKRPARARRRARALEPSRGRAAAAQRLEPAPDARATSPRASW